MSVSQHAHQPGINHRQPDAIPHGNNSTHDTKATHKHLNEHSERHGIAPATPNNSVLKPASETSSHLPHAAKKDDRTQAISLVRKKLAAIYGGDPPDAQLELKEATLPNVRHSQHQEYLLSLQQSGKSTAEIQAAWHAYYESLSDAKKREVWQEFYSQNAQQPPEQQPVRHNRHNAHAIYPTPTAELVITPTNITTGEAANTPIAAGPSDPEPHPNKPSVQPHPAEHQDERHFEHQPATVSAMPGASTDGTSQPGNTPPHDAGISVKNPLTEHLLTYEDIRQPSAVRHSIQNTVGKRRKLEAKHHLKSLAFGLAIGGATLLVVMFSFFNEVIIAPFLQPSRNVSATPIIVTPGSTIPTDKDEIVIPKINVQIPLVFDAKSSEKADFEAALDRGVAHYPTTALPGEKGNTSFFGHSSNNIFNPGKYKFAFVLLNELVPGDTFYINYKGVSYAYQVYDKKVVEATAVEILNPVADKAATAMLVTCDPPGTTLHRLVIWGEQVTPNPNNNTAPATPTTTAQATEALPGNGKSLWSRIWGWATGGE